MALLVTTEGVAVYNDEATAPISRLQAPMGAIAIVNRSGTTPQAVWTNANGGTHWTETGLYGTRSPWITLDAVAAFAGAFRPFAGRFAPAFRLDGNGNCVLRGAIGTGTLPATAFFTLPVGFRPQFQCGFAVACYDGAGDAAYGTIDVLTTGVVRPGQSFGAMLPYGIDGICFPLA